MIELYHASMSVCSEKVRMALAEKGLEFKSHFMNLREGHQQTPDYIKLNPNAVVPTLVHDGNVIIESAVINEYIAEVFPGTPLTTSSPVSRARMRVWWKQLDESIHAFTGVISSALAFRYQMLQKPKEEIDASFAKMVDPVRRARMRDVMEKGTESQHFAPAIRRFDKMLADMQASLANDAWLAGSEFSLADIAFAPYVTRLDHLQMSWMWNSRPKVADWYSRVRSRPSYAESHTKWFTPPVLKIMEERGKETIDQVRRILAA
ncbi:MAG: glutathione S-transferase family protein [Xanthobacteraceae bacterium]|jgi:glutathione S-transferase